MFKKNIKWFKEKIKTRWFLGIIVGILCFLLGCAFSYWLVYYNIGLQEKQNEINKNLQQPNVSIQVFSGDKWMGEGRWISLQLDSTKANSNIVDKLDFYIDIPGIIMNSSTDEYESTCDIHTKTLSVIPNGQNPIPDMQRVDVTCTEIYPKGGYTLFLNYKPYEELNYEFVQEKYNITWPDSFHMEFNNYLKYNYYWHYNGQLIPEENCVILSNLSYMKRMDDKLWTFLTWPTKKGKNTPDTLEEYIEQTNPCKN